MPNYAWAPIEPLSEADKNIDLAGIEPLYENWRAYRGRLATSGSSQLNEFNAQLIRRLSVETGIIEQLYDLDRGTTEMLVAHGFVEDLIARTDTEVSRGSIVDYLRDQEAAIHLVVDCISSNRPLSKGLIHELHAILTQHQEFTEAVDQFGGRFKTRLLRGEYKKHPNNPRRSDGLMHEYCPPIHVNAEMDKLITWFSSYEDNDPVILAAWLHHRFSQIHPYQDGNGRLSRALVTMVLLRAGLLPLIIDRDSKAEYIQDLEAADYGDLSKLTHFLASLERAAILQALSIDAEVKTSGVPRMTSAVIGAISGRLNRRREERHLELRRVNQVAVALRKIAQAQLDGVCQDLGATLIEVQKVSAHSDTGGTDSGNGYYFKYEVTASAKKSGHFANFNEDHYFNRASVKMGHDRLLFIISFHHAGRELSGVMEVTAFGKLETVSDTDQPSSPSSTFIICSSTPFVLTHLTEAAGVQAAFMEWVDAAFAVGLSELAERI